MTDIRALHKPVSRPDATTIAYGIGHAGAGASVWNPVAESVGESVEIRALRLPARENRITTPAHPSVDQAAAEIARVVTDDAKEHGKPALVIGSCSGVLLALAALDIMGDAPFVRASVFLRPPTEEQMGHTDAARVTSLDLPSLNEWLRKHQLTPAAVLDNDTMFKFFEPVVRADFAMVHGYRYRGRVLPYPTYVIPTADAWLTAATNVVREDAGIAGDPLTEHPHELAGAITEIAEALHD
ncbi:MAG TPA: thioesterase domain-containing protein [Candidatus Limnocylindrales bacterium]|nr:thioesterase domain-containing protein [Candidatus Limnocylindrales bacterium]